METHVCSSMKAQENHRDGLQRRMVLNVVDEIKIVNRAEVIVADEAKAVEREKNEANHEVSVDHREVVRAAADHILVRKAHIIHRDQLVEEDIVKDLVAPKYANSFRKEMH